MDIFEHYRVLVLLNKMITIKSLQSDSHVITVTHKGTVYRLFRIDFGTDGSIYISFPYYKTSNGLVAKVVMPPSTTGQYDSLSLSDHGKCTSNLVKYSHHTSGEALFSLTGKVKTEIRKQSIRLEELNGHLFTLTVQGLQDFDQGVGEKYNHGWSKKRSIINFNLLDNLIGSIKFVGVWQSFENFKLEKITPSNSLESVGPQFCYKSDKPGFGFLLSPNEDNIFNRYILSLRATLEPIIDKERESAACFIGGFDDIKKVNQLNEEVSFLSMVYPIDKPEEFLKKIGSIDI